MPQSISAYYDADRRFSVVGLLKTACYAAIGFAIAFYAMPSSAAPAPELLVLSTDF